MKTKASTVINKRVASSVKASMDFEGLKPSAYAQKIGERYLGGEINSQEALAKIKAKHTSKFGR
ncbi:MAG: antitoxin VbhA family protein [Syntrophomonadaceae bacterium]